MKVGQLALVALIGLSACAAAKSRYAVAGAQVAGGAPAAVMADPTVAATPAEAIVVEGTIAVEVTDVGAAAGGLRGEVEASGGRIVDERLDGGGYPLGLKDHQIRRETRIITVCDYYDALSSDRPYRAAMSREESLAIIAADVGTAVDGDCFEALRAVARHA